jgi:hypothetical protein
MASAVNSAHNRLCVLANVTSYEVESWRPLQSSNIEFTMKRLFF